MRIAYYKVFACRDIDTADRDARHMTLAKLYTEMRKKDPLLQTPAVALTPEERKARQEAIRNRIRQHIEDRRARW